MQLLDLNEFVSYLKNTYSCIHKGEFKNYSSEFDGFCDSCNKEVFLKIHASYYQSGFYGGHGLPSFLYLLIECPRCHKKRFLHLIQVTYQLVVGQDDDGEDITEDICEVYKLGSLPVKEESYALKDIPAENTSLILTINEAMFCMEHEKNIAAAILFRRAIQILAKDILGATGKTLHHQLEWLRNNHNKLNINLSDLFHENAKLIKDVGNQGAHPDDDITLHDFKQEDVHYLHDLFFAIVNEIFIKPRRDKEIKDELRNRRKLKP
jgi:hypothetical protein